MRIAYVNYLKDINKLFGVYKKVVSQNSTCKKMNLKIDFFILSESKVEYTDDNVKVIILQKYSNYILRQYNLLKRIAETFSNYDIVILRHITFSPFFMFNFKNKKLKLVTEHHTKELPELFINRDYIKYISEFLFVNSCFKLVDGLISVTDEIKEYEINRGFRKKDRAITIANGVNVESVKFTGFVPFDGKSLNIIFVASNLASWQGLDRFLMGLENYNGKVNIKLHLVGNINKQYIEKFITDKSKVEIHGALYSKELDTLFKEMNLAISSLGIHRNNMKEACPLKTREYTARGIPFIIAYKDTDLLDNLPFYKNFSSNDEPINIDEVIKFTESISHKDEISKQMREYALKKMDWKSKMKRYYELAELVCN
jgi:glycosyltransferase involved in cell wall biosynthesis